MTIDIFFKIDAPLYRAHLEKRYRVHQGRPSLERLDERLAQQVHVVVTSGFLGMSREDMARFPALKLICCIGTGYERVDLEAARERGVFVTHAAGTNASAVADHAMALLLAVVRNIPGYDSATKAGNWRGSISPRPLIDGKRLGIIGMGDIGQRIARRATGFNLEISYMARAPKPELSFKFKASAVELAEAADFLICAASGGAATHHLINEAVLEALGSKGYLVNVGRGSIVDTHALIDALESGLIAGAAVDVFEDEPNVPEALRSCPNAILTPHVGGVAPEVQSLSAILMENNIAALLAGQPLVSPVSEMRIDDPMPVAFS